MLALHEAGRNFPADVSVIGFDDAPESEFFITPLTTVRQDRGDVGQRCVDLLRSRIAGGLKPPPLATRPGTTTPPSFGPLTPVPTGSDTFVRTHDGPDRERTRLVLWRTTARHQDRAKPTTYAGRMTVTAESSSRFVTTKLHRLHYNEAGIGNSERGPVGVPSRTESD